jgi:hypothetical protein
LSTKYIVEEEDGEMEEEKDDTKNTPNVIHLEKEWLKNLSGSLANTSIHLFGSLSVPHAILEVASIVLVQPYWLGRREWL